MIPVLFVPKVYKLQAKNTPGESRLKISPTPDDTFWFPSLTKFLLNKQDNLIDRCSRSSTYFVVSNQGQKNTITDIGN